MDELARWRELRDKDEPLTDGELRELRTLTRQVMVRLSGPDAYDIKLSAAIETIIAIRQFDKASGELVSTTNALTIRIKRLTTIGVWFAARGPCAWPRVRGYLSGCVIQREVNVVVFTRVSRCLFRPGRSSHRA